jgi:hypothetical protein
MRLLMSKGFFASTAAAGALDSERMSCTSLVGVGGRKEVDVKFDEQWMVGDELRWGLSAISWMTLGCGVGWRSEGSDINGLYGDAPARGWVD